MFWDTIMTYSGAMNLASQTIRVTCPYSDRFLQCAHSLVCAVKIEPRGTAQNIATAQLINLASQKHVYVMITYEFEWGESLKQSVSPRANSDQGVYNSDRWGVVIPIDGCVQFWLMGCRLQFQTRAKCSVNNLFLSLSSREWTRKVSSRLVE